MTSGAIRRSREYYDYMLSYSPYDQIKRQAYPAMFVGAGLWDSQVQYYEPTKYVARLRAAKTDSNPLVYPRQHGGRARRQVGPVRAISLAGRILRVHARPAWGDERSTSTGHCDAGRARQIIPSFA